MLALSYLEILITLFVNPEVEMRLLHICQVLLHP